MSNLVQDITFNVGGSIFLDCPEGRPSSVTSVSVYENSDGDDGTAESATTGSAAVETNPDTTLDGAAAAFQRVIPLTATTGADAGRVYLVTSADGPKEWTQVESVSAGVSITAQHPLHNSFAPGDTFESTRISIALDSTWIADTNNISYQHAPNPRYRVRWEYVVATVTHVRDSYFDLVRYKGALDHGVTAIDVERMTPGFRDRLPSHHRKNDGRDLIEEAAVHVQTDLYQEGKGDELARNGAVIDELIKRKTVMLWAESRVYSGSGTTEAVELAERMYQSRFDQLIRVTNKVPFADDSGGGATRQPAQGLTVR